MKLSVRQGAEENMRKFLTCASGALVVGLTLGGSGFAKPKSSIAKTCSGILTEVKDFEGNYQLENASGGELCDSYIGEVGSATALKQVLKVCVVGHRCHIRGLIRGHGAFWWVKIFSVHR